MKDQFRAPAVPLVTVDPYLSVWSFANKLYDDFTRHWTGKRNSMTGIIIVDGVKMIFAGKVEPDPELYFPEPLQMKQTGLEILPLTTTYGFESHGIELTVRFTTPLLLENLDILSRPVSYVDFSIRSIDGKCHDVSIYFDVSGEWCVNNTKQQVVWGRKALEGDFSVMFMGTDSQEILKKYGDDVRIDWGYFYMGTSNSAITKTFIGTAADRKNFMYSSKIREGDMETSPITVEEHPIMASLTCLKAVGEQPVSFCITLAYDDIKSVEYFGDALEAYWRKNGVSFDSMLVNAIKEHESIIDSCAVFEKRLVSDAVKAGGEKYADLISLAYRQSIAAHKLVTDKNGEVLFISKECFSNGCAATVDVTYPSIPLFLLYNTELVKGMLRPIFKYAAMKEWEFDFAPHDVGCYPKANGQVYGENKLEYQMPVEECGNMLITTAAVCVVDKEGGFAKENWELISLWGEYLVKKGFDPENQLCTDDFAGHLAHNSNLSIKAIMGIASYSILCSMLGMKEESDKLMGIAKEMAVKWEAKANDGDHYKLAFNQEGSWSLKYNMLWDKLFGTDIFPEEIVEQELSYYLSKQNKYGIPLDSRNTYTKTDWLVWVASMAETKELFEEMIRPLWDFANESLYRVPFTDWYDTITAAQMNFQHRSVLGGIFIKILKDKGILKA